MDAHASRLANCRTLVVGDVMLDRYWFGDVERISPEAPVPIVSIRQTEERLGGAANVARNMTSLGARAGLLTVLGDDEAGTVLKRLIDESSIQAHLHFDTTLTTTVKLRVVGRRQQMLRADFESTPDHEVLRSLLGSYGRLVDNYDVVVLSDYGKGGREARAGRSQG